MFEQSLYNQEPVEKVETREGDLFHNYEIKNWEIGPHLYKILAISAVFNVLAILIVAQTSLLTMKGCDSPLVGRVCQVLDTVYMGTMLFGTDREYVDAAYEKTDLADADITFVDVSGVTGPIDYPESFVDLNTGQPVAMFPQAVDPMAMAGDSGITPIMPDSGSSMFNTAPIPPPSNPNAITGEFPTSASTTGPNIPAAKNNKPSTAKSEGDAKSKSPDKLPEFDEDNTANSNSKTPDKTAEAPVDEAKQNEYGVYLNKRPLKDLAKDALAKLEAKAVTLDKPFKVVIAGTLGLGKDGKTVVLKNPRVVRAKDDPKNDPAIEALAKESIIAVGDAGWFGFLTRLDPKPKSVVVTIQQNDTELLASVKADQPSENQANTQASSLGVIIRGASLLTGGDEKTFLQNASVTAEGKNFVLNVKLPKKDVQEMILRKLAELKEKEAKPNGSAQAEAEDNTAKK